MLRRNIQQMFVLGTAVLSLFVASISACACTHHQSTPETEKPSCHSSGHDEASPDSSDGLADLPLTDSLGEGCNCFVNTQVPAVIAKSDSKQIAIERAILVALTGAPELILRIDRARSVAYSPKFSPYSSPPRLLGPSRAPPRL